MTSFLFSSWSNINIENLKIWSSIKKITHEEGELGFWKSFSNTPSFNELKSNK